MSDGRASLGGVRRSWLALATVLAVACDPAPGGARHGLGDASTSSADAGAGLDPKPRGFAVVSSDYAVTSIGLLAPDGTTSVADFIDSGSASTGLVTALSGDVVLPTRSDEHGVLVLIDGFRTDVVTRIDLGSGEILGQVKMQAPNAQASTAYSANPRDYVRVDRGSAWVSRYEPNVNAGAGDPDLGTDLIEIDPTAFERSGRRVDFSAWNGQGERTNSATGQRESVPVYARPSGVVRLGGFLVVGLELLSVAFDAIADSMVALVDLDSLAVTVTDLPGLQSCGDLEPVPDEPLRIAVGCTGFYRGVPRDTAGLAVLALEGSTLTLERTWRAKDDPASALSVFGVQPIDATHVLATAPGAVDGADGGLVPSGTPDVLYLVDLGTGAQQKVLAAHGAFVIGRPAYDPRGGLLLVPDASVDSADRPTAGVHRLRRVGDGSFEALGTTKLDAVLPARAVRIFD